LRIVDGASKAAGLKINKISKIKTTVSGWEDTGQHLAV